MAMNIMIQGTMSNAGKSLLAAGLCRVLKQDGYRVAPFKSQNMALNSFITKDGGEMGRAQVVQAEAAGIEPDTRMNPILLKPTTDVGSQVIVNGQVRGNMQAMEYFRRKRDYIPAVLEAYNSLAAEYDVIVIEGAGSPAEINLKQDDIVNMGLAKLVDAPVLLVGDIDRGFVGYPVASLCLKSEAKRIKAQIDAGELQVDTAAGAVQAAAAGRKKLIPALPDKYNTPNAIIAKVILVALLSVWVSSLFHDAVNKLVWCLIFGVLCKELGFLDEDALGKAHATGIVMPIITLSIFTNLASATTEMVGGMVVPLLVCVVIGTVAFSVVSILVGKIFGYSWQMSMAIGSSCLFGFPGTVIISNEVSESTGTTAEENAFINEQIMPKMLVAGMVTVSITSVLVAGVMSGWL